MYAKRCEEDEGQIQKQNCSVIDCCAYYSRKSSERIGHNSNFASNLEIYRDRYRGTPSKKTERT